MYLASDHQPKINARKSVLVVGAGPSGIGVAAVALILNESGWTGMEIAGKSLS